MNDNISVISSRNPKERIPLLINILYEYGIRQEKRILFQNFDIDTSFYINHLLSLISKIDFKLIESYMLPVDEDNHLKNKDIDNKTFLTALEKIRKSHIVIKNYKSWKDGNWLDYIFNFNNPYSVIIIDNFATFIEKTKMDINTIKRRINQYSKKYNAEIILFINDSKLKKYSFPNWKKSKVNEPFRFKFDKDNYSILEIKEGH